jgi:hypothetical protein
MKPCLTLLFLLFAHLAKSQSSSRFFPIPQPYLNHFFLESSLFRSNDSGYVLSDTFVPDIPHGFSTTTSFIKTDSNFFPVWRKDFCCGKGSAINYEFPNHNFLSYLSNVNFEWFAVEKFNSFGQTSWCKYLKRPPFYGIDISSSAVLPGRIIFAGGVGELFLNQLSSNGFIAIMDTSGSFIHMDSLKFLSPYNNSSIHKLLSDTAGNLFVIGSIINGSFGDNFIMKINPSNNIDWCKKLNMTFSPIGGRISDAIILSNGQILIAGGFYYNSNFSATLLQFSSNGNITWSKRIFNPLDTLNTTISTNKLIELERGKILLTGLASIYQPTQFTEYHYPIIVKLDSNGVFLNGIKHNYGRVLCKPYRRTSNSWYFPSDFYNPVLINTDSNGHTICGDSIYSMTTNSLPFSAFPITCAFYSVSLADSLGQGFPVQSQNYIDTCEYIPTIIDPLSKNPSLKIFPNPSSGKVYIECSERINEIIIVNCQGSLIKKIKPKKSSIDFDLNNSGLYFIQIHTKGNIMVEKLIVK